MDNSKLITYNSLFIRDYIKDTIIILCISILIPFLLHLISLNGIHLGSVLLALFYAPFFAVIFFRFSTALITSLIAPVGNYLLTNSPDLKILPAIILLLCFFVTFAYLLKSKPNLKKINAPLSFILALIAEGLLSLVVPIHKINLANTLSNGLPGLVILFIINIISVKLERINSEW